MDPAIRSEPLRWCLMATVQVAEGAPDLADILADLDYGFQLEPLRHLLRAVGAVPRFDLDEHCRADRVPAVQIFGQV